MRRADRIKAIKQRRQQGDVVFVQLKGTADGPPVFLGPVIKGRRKPTADETETARQEGLALWRAEQAKRPRAPKALGSVRRTLAARDTVRAAKQQPASETTRLARCQRCRQQFETAAGERGAVCPSCGTGGN